MAPQLWARFGQVFQAPQLHYLSTSFGPPFTARRASWNPAAICWRVFLEVAALDVNSRRGLPAAIRSRIFAVGFAQANLGHGVFSTKPVIIQLSHFAFEIAWRKRGGHCFDFRVSMRRALIAPEKSKCRGHNNHG
jgi:hypothetical protein